MPVGLLLQSLLKSLFLPPPPSPIPSSSISLNVRGRSCSVFIRFLWLIFSLGPDEEPFTPLSKPYSRGQCQDAPGCAHKKNVRPEPDAFETRLPKPMATLIRPPLHPLGTVRNGGSQSRHRVACPPARRVRLRFVQNCWSA